MAFSFRFACGSFFTPHEGAEIVVVTAAGVAEADENEALVVCFE